MSTGRPRASVEKHQRPAMTLSTSHDPSVSPLRPSGVAPASTVASAGADRMDDVVGVGELLGHDHAPSVDDELAGFGRVQCTIFSPERLSPTGDIQDFRATCPVRSTSPRAERPFARPTRSSKLHPAVRRPQSLRAYQKPTSPPRPPRTSPANPRRASERGARAPPAPEADLVVRSPLLLAFRVSPDVGVKPEPAPQWLASHGPTLGVAGPAGKGRTACRLRPAPLAVGRAAWSH